MIEGMERCLEDSGQAGLEELRQLLGELLGGNGVTGRLVEQWLRELEPVLAGEGEALDARPVSVLNH